MRKASRCVVGTNHKVLPDALISHSMLAYAMPFLTSGDYISIGNYACNGERACSKSLSTSQNMTVLDHACGGTKACYRVSGVF